MPAMSNKAVKTIRDEMRSWRIHNRTDKSLEDFSRMFNPQAAGMDQLLCEVLQIRDAYGVLHSESRDNKMGHEEI